MALDHYIHERLAYSRIADNQRLADEQRALARLEEVRRQGLQPMSSRWFSRLLRLLAMGHISDRITLQRL
jgi:hypothetical protein